MNDEVLISRKLHVDNIDPELYQQFKMCLLKEGLTMREVIIDYLKGFIKAVEAESKKSRAR